jgi:hypothetical protein
MVIFHSFLLVYQRVTHVVEFVDHLGEMATLIVFPEKKRLLNPRLVVQFERFVGRSVCGGCAGWDQGDGGSILSKCCI